MKRALSLIIAFFGVWVGAAWAQTTVDDPLFIPIRQLGEFRPQGIQYESQFDQFAWVDSAGQLVLVDAATYVVKHVLYEAGAYNAYRFSHNGRWLALAIDRRIELWDTASGEQVALFEPNGANLVQGLLHFTPDDRYLLLDTVVPAPQETRRSENDTSIIPWLWDLEAARGERSSRYASAEDGYPFFEYRNGLVIGANNLLIGGIPNRLMLIDGAQSSFPTIGEIASNRFERDPITVWRSATDTMLYTDPGTGGIVQIDTANGAQFNLPIGADLSYRNLTTLENLRLADSARVICPNAGRSETALLRLIYGENYLDYQGYEPLTFTLVDVLQPLTMGQERGALLLYSYNELRGRGVMELVRPPDVQQMLLSPDGTRLMIRRASGEQAIELYDLESCTRDLMITPAETDGIGANTLAFNVDGSVIISDFQRFDARSGDVLAHQLQYTRPFERMTFGDDGETLVTMRGAERIWWDVDSGLPIQRLLLPALDGEVLRVSPDETRYLLRSVNPQGADELELVDVRQDIRRTLEISPLPNYATQILAISPSWESVLVGYQPQRSGDAEGIAVYTFGLGQRLFLSAADLPPAGGRSYGWLDEQTAYVTGDPYGSVSEPIYGVEYDPSGLPACLVEEYPNAVESFGLIWEAIRLRSSAETLNRLTQRLCAALPDNADALVAALTPTAPFRYNSDPTPLPYAIPGVPLCLTERFPFEAVRYAALWREISANATPEQLVELEAMLCEGLLGSIGGIAATPTIDPNLNVPPTPTPIDAAPQTVDGGAEFRPVVYAIDIATGQRSQGDYLPTTPPFNPNILANLYFEQFNGYPAALVLSPDARLVAALDGNGFITLYRLSRPYSYEQLTTGDGIATPTPDANAAPVIGLAPTATAAYEAIGGIQPTLTPTVTIAPPLLTEATLPNWSPAVTEVCPSRTLYTLDNPPPDYAATGRLLTESYRENDALWVIEPASGRAYGDAALHPCTGNCNYSPDRQWIVRQSDTVTVSRPDGTGEMTVIPTGSGFGAPYDVQWLPDNTLRITYTDYLPAVFRDQGRVQRIFDPATGRLGEPFAPREFTNPVRIGELGILSVNSQPGGRLAVVTTSDGAVGTKFWIYDFENGQAEYFALDASDGSWHPSGLYFSYRVGEHGYRYDPQQRAHYRLDQRFDSGVWSPDRARRADFYFDMDEAQARIAAGELPLKLQIQDDNTGAITRYCIPQTGAGDLSIAASPVWSPDGRYLALIVYLPVDGDYFPTPGPTLVPYTTAPTLTPVPLEVQYDTQFPRTLVLDTQTGSVMVLGSDANNLVDWITGGGQ
jgi:hypothetical protein